MFICNDSLGAPASNRKRVLIGALLVALGLPGTGLAQAPQEKELAARVAGLEKMVEHLMAQLQARAGETGSVQVAVPVAFVPPFIQSAPILPGATPGTRFGFGGFIKLDASVTRTNDGDIPDGTVGRTLYVPRTVPVGGGRTREGGLDTDMAVHYSRFWLSADTEIDSVDKLKAYFELDLYGGGSTAYIGNEMATNTYAVTLRHAYVRWNDWLAGQTWSNFQDVAAAPDMVDILGSSEGTVFARQSQLRYTTGSWSFSIENPETVYTPHLGDMAQVQGDDGAVPDITARYAAKGAWGHFGIAGIARQLKYQDGTSSNGSTGYGASVSGKFNVGQNNDFRYMVTTGSGIGRYVGLALNNDAVLDANGALHNIDLVAGYASWRHVFSPKLRGNACYSLAQYDNPTDFSGRGITRSAESAHINLIYSPLTKLELGGELMWAKRELENGDAGELDRVQAHVKYSF